MMVTVCRASIVEVSDGGVYVHSDDASGPPTVTIAVTATVSTDASGNLVAVCFKRPA